MNLAPLPPPHWVDRPAALEKMAAELMRHPRVAVDTESNSLHAYREQVCLIQFSTPQADYLVDPLAIIDLSPLSPIFENPNIEKIFHAAEYDIYCLHRDFGFNFANLFDTMQAARILGYKMLGLGTLLTEKFGIDVDKHHQKADWAVRPLSDSQVDYARLDTHYLIELRDLLDAELTAAGLRSLADEDFVRVCQPVNGNGKNARQLWERVSGYSALSPRELTVLNELCLYRERLAEQLNRPIFKVIGDDRLVKLAQEMPASRLALEESHILTPHQMHRFGDKMLSAIARGQKAPIVSQTRSERLPDAVLARLEKLKDWRKKTAEKMKVESDVILPKVYLHAIAEENPPDLESLGQVMKDSPWRLEHFGDEILKTIAPKKRP